MRTNKWVLNQVSELADLLNDYRLNSYIYGFTTFLEVLLLGEYSTEYIIKTISMIEQYAYEYREIYTKSYNYLENITNKTLEKFTYSGVVKVNDFLGKVNEKLPIKIKNEGKIKCLWRKVYFMIWRIFWLNLQKTANLI